MATEPQAPWREAVLAGVHVTISEPAHTEAPLGVTFLLTGALVPQQEYSSTRQVLVEEQNQIVIGIYINVLTTAHQWYANKIPLIHQAYFTEERNRNDSDTSNSNANQSSHLKDRFHVVGHSAGGKICLLVAATECPDPPHVHTVLALDPVDLNPSVFTGRSTPLSMDRSPAHALLLTWADATSSWSIPPAHNALAIDKVLSQQHCKALLPLVIHKGAGHMAYTDTGGGWLGSCLFPGGDKEANRAALQNVHDLIRKYIC